MNMPMFPTFVRDTWGPTAVPDQVVAGCHMAEAITMGAVAAATPMFTANVDRLFGLLAESGSDEYGEHAPTQYAFKTASELIWAAEKQMAGPIPKGSPSVDSLGGIRFTWRRGEAQLRLVCPADASKPVYLYQQTPTGPQMVDRDVSAQMLAERLRWLSGVV
jgi:hypothetical protein